MDKIIVNGLLIRLHDIVNLDLVFSKYRGEVSEIVDNRIWFIDEKDKCKKSFYVDLIKSNSNQIEYKVSDIKITVEGSYEVDII